MYAQGPALALCQYVKIASGLRGFYGAESVFLARHWEIGSVIAGDLQKDAGIRAAFICLAGGVQEPWAKSQTGGDALAIANGVAHGLQAAFMLTVHLDVGQQSQIVACA